MKERTYIYLLEDPENGVPRYVGKSNNPFARLNGHIREAKNTTKNDHKNNWIRSILKRGLTPVVSILDDVSKNEWEFWELWWYQYFKGLGFSDMVNDERYLGIGSTFKTINRKKTEWNDKQREKLSNSKKEQYKNPTQKTLDMLEQLGKRNSEKIWTEEDRKNLGETQRKRYETPTQAMLDVIDNLNIMGAEVRRKPIIQYSLDGVFIKEWNCARALQNEFNRKIVRDCCNGIRENGQGFMWRWGVKKEAQSQS